MSCLPIVTYCRSVPIRQYRDLSRCRRYPPRECSPPVYPPQVPTDPPWESDGGLLCVDYLTVTPPRVCCYLSSACSQLRKGAIVRLLSGGRNCPLCRRWTRVVHGHRVKSQGRTMTLDHMVPVALGGTGHPHNLWALCSECNRRKSDQDPRKWILTLDPKDQEWIRPMVDKAVESLSDPSTWTVFYFGDSCGATASECHRG